MRFLAARLRFLQGLIPIGLIGLVGINDAFSASGNFNPFLITRSTGGDVYTGATTGTSFGNFSSGSTWLLEGGEISNWADGGGGDRADGAEFFYSVYRNSESRPGFTTVSLPFVSQNGNDKKWAKSDLGLNLAGSTVQIFGATYNGTYNIDYYFRNIFNWGSQFNSAGTSTGGSAPTSNFYTATYTLTGYDYYLGQASGSSTQSGNSGGSATLTGSVGIGKFGAGTVQLTATGNNYTGRTLVAAGTLQTTAAGVIPDGSDVLIKSGAVLDLNNNNETVASVGEYTQNDGGTITLGSGTLTVNGSNKGNKSQNSITGTGNVTFSSSGTTYRLYGTQGYTGTTTVTAGTVQTSVAMSSGAFTINGGTFETLGADQISNTASVTLGGGTLKIGGTETFGNNGVTLTASTSSTVSVNSGVTASVSGSVTGSGNLSKSDSGQFNLSGDNNYSGTTTVSGGVLEAQSANALGSTAAATTVSSGAQLKLWNSAGGITYGAEALNLNGGGISSDGALQNVSGNNTWTGAVTLQSGSRIHSSAGTLTLDVASGSAITGTFQLNIGGAGNVTVNDNINISTAKLVKDGAGILKLNAGMNYSGNTEVDGGEIWFGNSGSANSSTIWIGNGGSMSTTAKVWIESGGTTISSAINVNNGNANTRFLGGLNTTGTATYSGAIGVNNGDLNLEANNAGGTVEFTGAVTTSSGKYVTASGPGLVILSGTGNNTGIGANVNSGTLRLAKTSSGSVRALNATPIVNNGGTLQFGGTGGDQLPDNVSVTINTGGRLDMNGVNETIGGFTLNGTGNSSTGAIINSSSTATTLTLGGQANLASDSSVGGTGDIIISGNQRIVSSVVGTGRTLTKVGANTVTLANGTSTQDNTDLFVTVTAGKLVLAKASADGYHAAGGFTVGSGGTLQLGGSGGFQIWKGATTTTVNSGGTFDLNGQNQTFTSAGPTISGTGVSSGGALINSSTAASSTLSSAVILAGDSSVGGAGNLTISGIISQSGGNRALTKVGTGTLTVSQNNSFAGNATINEGKVTMSHANGLGLGAITVNAGADLEVTGGITVARNLTLSAVNGAIRGGRLMSSGASKNTYSGTVAVNNSEFDVASGNTLDVTGKISGTGTVTKTGAGELQLSNTGNDYSGITDVQNGTLTASSIANSGTASTIGTGSEVKVGSSANAGTFKYTGGTAGMNRTVTVGSAGGTINVDNSTTTMTLTGTVAGSGATLTKTGAGKMALGSGSSATVSTIAIQQGTLLLGASDTIGDSTGITMSGGTLDTAGYSDQVGQLKFSGSNVSGAIIGLSSSNNGFLFSSLDTSAGSIGSLADGGLTFRPSATTLYSTAGGLSIKLSTADWVAAAGGSTTLNGFNAKVSFADGTLASQISFSGGVNGTYLNVAAIPEPKVYVAAGALALLIGLAEFRRRKRAKSAV